MRIILFLFGVLFLTSFSVDAQKKIDSTGLKRQSRKFVREGNKLYKQEKFTDASVQFKKALEKNSVYKKATYNLGNALYQGKNFKEAAPQFDLAAKGAKDKTSKAQSYHNLGNSMMELKKYPEAVEAYKNALRNNPNDDETRYNLAVAKSKLEDQKQNKKNDQKNKEDNKKDKKEKDDPNNKDKKDGKDKDKKDPKKDNDKGDDDKKKKDPNKDEKKNKKKPKPKPSKLSPQQLKQLLESLNNEEKKTQKKMNAKKAKGPKVKQEKDW